MSEACLTLCLKFYKSKKELIVKWCKEGKTFSKISKLLNINRSTIHYTIKKSKFKEFVKNMYRSDHIWKLTESEKRNLIYEVKKSKDSCYKTCNSHARDTRSHTLMTLIRGKN